MIAPNPFSPLLDPTQLGNYLSGEPHHFDLIARGTMPHGRRGLAWSLTHSLQKSEAEFVPVNVKFGQVRWTVVLYRTAQELYQRWNDFDRQEARPGQGVVFGLSTEFQGHLPALIRRDSLGELLVLCHLPGCPATVRRFLPADLPAEDLGWSQIEVVQQFATLPQQADASDGGEQSWLIFWPHGLASDQIRQYAELPRMM